MRPPRSPERRTIRAAKLSVFYHRLSVFYHQLSVIRCRLAVADCCFSCSRSPLAGGRNVVPHRPAQLGMAAPLRTSRLQPGVLKARPQAGHRRDASSLKNSTLAPQKGQETSKRSCGFRRAISRPGHFMAASSVYRLQARIGLVRCRFAATWDGEPRERRF